VRKWAGWHRRQYGDRLDYEDIGNHALYRAWATYKPGQPREWFHLRYHLRSALSAEIKRQKRREAIIARRQYKAPPVSATWMGFDLVDYCTDHGPAIPQHPII
jgi:hypothetical protein